MRECINAVFESWNTERAIVYRKAHGLQNLEGTAVTVQSMVNSEVSGIAFTAGNPSKPMAEEIIIEGVVWVGQAIILRGGDAGPVCAGPGHAESEGGGAWG